MKEELGKNVNDVCVCVRQKDVWKESKCYN